MKGTRVYISGVEESRYQWLGLLDAWEQRVMSECTGIEDDYTLEMITYIFLSIALICLCLTILTFVLCVSVHKGNTALHLHLSLCLFMANLLFLVGVGVSKTENKVVCSVIAGVLHYLFLATFVWMWLEGVHLLLLIKNLRVVKYSSRNQVCTLHLLLVGYGIPAVIVAISAGVYSEGYGTAKSCWLSHERKFIWSFLGPVCIIIVVNIIVFALILYGLRSQIGNLNTDLSKLRDNR
ncbi:adhesion G protein-coupled receptor E3-like [Amia ocellicauda]|uniref:adhesion G protein-coupled receptor E3-like n=1 Tax=Amia ocellicauda TaxID=2972642 RepID=UPI0034645722